MSETSNIELITTEVYVIMQRTSYGPTMHKERLFTSKVSAEHELTLLKLKNSVNLTKVSIQTLYSYIIEVESYNYQEGVERGRYDR